MRLFRLLFFVIISTCLFNGAAYGKGQNKLGPAMSEVLYKALQNALPDKAWIFTGEIDADLVSYIQVENLSCHLKVAMSTPQNASLLKSCEGNFINGPAEKSIKLKTNLDELLHILTLANFDEGKAELGEKFWNTKFINCELVYCEKLPPGTKKTLGDGYCAPGQKEQTYNCLVTN